MEMTVSTEYAEPPTPYSVTQRQYMTATKLGRTASADTKDGGPVRRVGLNVLDKLRNDDEH